MTIALAPFRRLADLSVGSKFALLLALVSVPLALLASIYIGQVRKDEAIAQQELAGSSAFQVLWSGYVSAASRDAGRMAAAAGMLQGPGSGIDQAFARAGEVASFAAALAAGPERGGP